MKNSHPNDVESKPSAVTNGPVLEKSNLKGDWLNFFLLLLLYTMQGLPLGLSSVVPILIQSKKVSSYQDQALFSLTSWPFSLKLLWAPLVDSLYIRRIGRRKTWLVSVQYILGAFLFYMANDFDNLLPATGKPNIVVLVYTFFITNFLAATQDIVVDGWALTMLNKNNVGHASTCNTAGQTFGMILGYTIPVLLTSENFCNKYLRITPQPEGIITMQSFLYFLGITFISVTTLIAILKKEKSITVEPDHVDLNAVQTYSLLWDILKIPNVQTLAIIVLTARIGFSATDSISYLKLIDAGVPKDDIVVIDTIMQVINIVLFLVVAKYTSGPKPMSIYLKATPIRLLWGLVYVVLIYYTPAIIKTNGFIDVPMYYYVILVFTLLVHNALISIMFVAIMAFFSRISDPRFGGTYMTLLNTITNLGSSLSSTLSLKMVDYWTIEECSSEASNDCSTKDLVKICQKNGGECVVTLNGYYLETVLCIIIGFIWYYGFGNILKGLQNKSPSHWLINMKRPTTENVETINSINMT